MGLTQISDHLSTISPRDQKFDHKKLNNLKVAELYKGGELDGHEGFMYGKKPVLFVNLAKRMGWCGEWLEFAQGEDGACKLIGAKFCKVPNCPMCQWRRCLVWRAKFFSQLPAIAEEYPKHRWVFLTLTQRNCQLSELRDTVKHMGDSFNRMRSLTDFPLLGWVRSLEVTRVYDWYDANNNFIGRHGVTWWFRQTDKTRNQWRVLPTDEVHPHYHFLSLVSPSYFSGSTYVTQQRWSEMWSQSLRVNYPTVVHIRTLKANKGRTLLPDPDQVLNSDRADQVKDPTGIFTAICETMKYTVKEQDLVGQFCKDDQANSQWLRDLTQQLYKMRRIEFGGILKPFSKGIVDSESNNQSLIKGGDDRESTMKVQRTFVVRWNNAIKKYVTLASHVDTDQDE